MRTSTTASAYFSSWAQGKIKEYHVLFLWYLLSFHKEKLTYIFKHKVNEYSNITGFKGSLHKPTIVALERLFSSKSWG